MAMTPGQMGYLVGGAYDGHLVIMLSLMDTGEKIIVSLSNPSVQFYLASPLQVRLLEPDEEVIIKGKS